MKRILMLLLSAALGTACLGCTRAPAAATVDPVHAPEQESPAAVSDDAQPVASSSLFGAFNVQGLDGVEYTQDIFSEHDMTLVNIMATWCGPCVREMPALQELSSQVADKGVGIVGIVSDTWYDGEIDQSAVDSAHEIQDATGATYPLLIPDAQGMQDVLDTVQAFPTTYFVDSKGRPVAAVEGSRDLDGWKEVVDKALSLLNSED